ncbi:MAG: DUF748 domain-containing protein [Planctomycetes bacterium]|nr:DUF748 domain-containing protein [Planctomycetota bacterium]MCP4771140.1 DUF748 domain-containing protein [Planctomycetota bacterium]MCP4862133.1 DUF748 domain-containing protein [Planctomycetota bacterium]
MISILRKGFILLVIVLVLVLVGTLVFGGDSLFGHALNKYGPVAFRQPVAFEKAELSVLGGSAGVEEFHVGTTEYPMIDIGKAEVNISTMAILDGRVVIENAELTKALMHLIVTPEGKLAFDSGPPPQEVIDEMGPVEGQEDLPEPKRRDFIQIAVEYYERYQQYKEYYDMLPVGSEEGETEEEEGLRRAKYPGMPEYVKDAQTLAAADAEGVFWMENASITDFNWNTVDKRNGKAILPDIDDFTFTLANIGTPPDGSTPAASYVGKGGLKDGGAIAFDLKMSRDATLSSLDFSAEALPVESIASLFSKSLPFRISGGYLDISTDAMQFNNDQLGGGVRIVLNGTTLKHRNNTPDILGVPAQEFCTLLNVALETQPVAFMIKLGGTPSSPTFDVENETDLGDMLGGAVKAEVERRAQEFVDEHVEELEEKASDLIKDKLGDKLPDGVGDQLDGALKGKVDVGGLFGDKKKKRD